MASVEKNYERFRYRSQQKLIKPLKISEVN